MLFVITFLIIMIVEALTEQKTGTKFQISTRIIGGQKVAKREDFAYQVLSLSFFVKHVIYRILFPLGFYSLSRGA